MSKHKEGYKKISSSDGISNQKILSNNENTSEDIAEEFAIPIGYTSRST